MQFGNFKVFFLFLTTFAFISFATAQTQVAPPSSEQIQAKKKQVDHKLTDAQIAQVILVANQADVEAGKLAEKKSDDNEVQRFARQTIQDQGSLVNATEKYAQKAKLKPVESELSRQLKKMSHDSLAQLNQSDKEKFDQAYVDQEVRFHQTLVQQIENELLPQAKDPQLKSLIEKTRTTVNSHLQHAKHVQSTDNQGIFNK